MADDLTFQGDGVIERYSNQLGILGSKGDIALARALNHTGAKAKTQVIRALTRQTGLKRQVIIRAVKVKRATHTAEQFSYEGRLSYALSTKGGDISLKFFAPKETARGVSAKVRGRRQLFADTFTHGGRFPDRIGPVMGGHVYRRAGKARLPVRQQDSGVYLPDELLQGETAAVFERVMTEQLAQRVSHEIDRLLDMPGL